MRLCGTEVFCKLNKERNFKNNFILFDDNALKVEIHFNSNDIEVFKEIVLNYGFDDDSSTYGAEYQIFLNDMEINKSTFDFNIVKPNDIISIFYKKYGIFNLYQHLIIHEIDDIHDDDYYFRKELEK